ncbi:MAG: DNA mismatch endonuclease Vsr [Bacteroidales bacterium]|nr:DNA mismatch endonuclease Vsr [Bacteroidales bacterium]
MTDRLTPEQRRRCMQANRSNGTQPERMLARELWRRGLRYRKNMRSVPGSPDICFKGRKVAVFVDGEFWHGRDWKDKRQRIQSNRDFWYAKIERNMVRDKRVDLRLKTLGWTVLRF